MDIKTARANSLKNRYLKHTGGSAFGESDDSPFVDFFETEILPTISYATLVAYRAAIRTFVNDPHALRQLSTMKAVSRKTLTKKTTSLRAKSLSQTEVDTLSDYAHKQEEADARSRYGSPTVMWLRATLLTGLRPGEWADAEISSASNTLVVANNKLSKCTGFDWPSRVIPLDHLDAREVTYIQDFLDITNDIKKLDPALSEHENFQKFRDSCSHWLNRASRHLFKWRKLHITLMSARHQFIANLKAGGYSPVEIAYLVGHGNDLRAFESYGRTSSGVKDIFLPAIPDEAADVMEAISKKLSKKVSKRQQLRQFVEEVNRNKLETAK